MCIIVIIVAGKHIAIGVNYPVVYVGSLLRLGGDGYYCR